MHKNRLINGRKGLAALLLAGIMAFTVSCGSSEEGTTAVGSTEDSGISAQDPGAADAAKLLLFKETHKVDDAAITGEGFGGCTHHNGGKYFPVASGRLRTGPERGAERHRQARRK